MVSLGNQHCATCIGTLSFPVEQQWLVKCLLSDRDSTESLGKGPSIFEIPHSRLHLPCTLAQTQNTFVSFVAVLSNY